MEKRTHSQRVKDRIAKKKAELAPQVTQSVSFAAVVRKNTGDPFDKTGNNKIVVKALRYFHHELNKFKDGEQVTMTITNRKPKRTEQQNRYYWGVYLPLVSQETGESDLEALHELFKGKFLTKKIVKVFGEPVRMKGSTTELGVGRFCEYVMAIQNLTGVEAPPTENYGLEALGEGIKKNEHEEVEE